MLSMVVMACVIAASAAWTLESDAVYLSVVPETPDLSSGALVWEARWKPSNDAIVLPSRLPALVTDHGESVVWDYARCAAFLLRSDSISVQPQTTKNATILSLTLVGRVVLLSPDGGSAPAPALISRTFELYPRHPSIIRTFGSMSWSSSSGSAKLVQAQILTLTAPGSSTVNFVRPALFHTGQHGVMPDVDFLQPLEMPIAINMGSYPSSQEDVGRAAWFALLTGSASPAAGALGITGGLEFNGKSILQAWLTVDPADAAILVWLEAAVNGLNYTVDADHVFAFPAAFVGAFNNSAEPGCSGAAQGAAGSGWLSYCWDTAAAVTQRFAEDHIYPPLPDDRYPYAQYNSWSYDVNINETNQLVALNVSIALGLEAFVLDFGWIMTDNETGNPIVADWRPDPVKFPRGLAPLADVAHAHGMRFGVHMALPQVNLKAPVAQAHPDWLTHAHPSEYFGATAFCLAHAPVRDWLAAQMIRVIDEYSVDYIVQDGEDMIKRCYHENHTHAPGDENYCGSTLGLDLILASVRSARPHVIIENCEDGGNMETFRMAALYDTSNSCDDSPSYRTRQGVWGHTYPFGLRTTARYFQDPPTRYTFRSAMFGGPLLLQERLGEFTPSQIALSQEMIAEYKRDRDMYYKRGSTVHHLEAPLYPPDALPPGLPGSSGDGYGWDSIQVVNASRTASAVFVYRAAGADGSAEAHTVFPRGLAPGLTYRCTFRDGHGGAATLAGSDIMSRGLPLKLAPLGTDVIDLVAVAAV